MQLQHLDKILCTEKTSGERRLGVVYAGTDARNPSVYWLDGKYCFSSDQRVDQFETVQVLGQVKYLSVEETQEKFLELYKKELNRCREDLEALSILFRQLFGSLECVAFTFVNPELPGFIILEREEPPVYEKAGDVTVGTDPEAQASFSIYRDAEGALYLHVSASEPPIPLSQEDLAGYFLNAQ